LSLLIIGSVALDSIQTPFGEKKDILGGSAVYASVAARFYCPVKLVAAVGEDFPEEHVRFLEGQKIDVRGLQRIHGGKTFRWSGYYEYDMNQAHTRDTKLNVLGSFDPKIPPEFLDAEFVFLANLDPALQLKVLAQIKRPKLVAMDTMNFWIENRREDLHKVIKKVDILLINDAELRQFMETPNLPVAARRLLELGVKAVIVKKGEHGALYFSHDEHFSAPSFPQAQFRDPTGAGDSFAGGFMGYLAKTDDLSHANIRRAIIVGSVMASFNVEDFSLDRLKRLQAHEIAERFAEFKRFSHFDAVEL